MGQFSPAYETDYYAWTQQQAQFLQHQQWNYLDIVNEFFPGEPFDFEVVL